MWYFFTKILIKNNSLFRKKLLGFYHLSLFFFFLYPKAFMGLLQINRDGCETLNNFTFQLQWRCKNAIDHQNHLIVTIKTTIDQNSMHLCISVDTGIYF